MLDRSVIIRKNIEKALEFFHPAEGTVFELCALNPEQQKSPHWSGYAGGKKGVVAGWFNDRKKAIDLAIKIGACNPEGIYITINPVLPALLARSKNKLKAGINRTTDKEIERLSILLIDIDPKRPQGISSTDAEHDFAIEHAYKIADALEKRGWPRPLIADSGNGAHLIYLLKELENTAENIELLKTLLQAINNQFMIHRDGITLEIDQKVFNPARISKLYGTMARKGDSTEERPHRLAQILEVPKGLTKLSTELIRKFIEDSKASDKAAASTQGGLISRGNDRRPQPSSCGSSSTSGMMDVEAYLSHYGIEHKGSKNNGSSTLYVLDTCVFDPGHNGGEAAIGQGSDGKLFYQCFHDSCKDKTWKDARQQISGADKLGRFMPEGFRSTSGGGSKGSALIPPSAEHTEQIEQRIAELNQRHAVIMLGGRCMILNEVEDPTFNRTEITFSPYQDFKAFHANEKYWVTESNGQNKRQDIGKIWFEAPERRQYRGIVFNPGNDIPEYYNLFKGFAISPKEGDWSLFKRHIFEVIANRNEKIFKYVLAWMAHLVQQPGGERPGTCIVLRGKQGTGKGCFVGHFGAIFGPHYLHITNAHQITGRFNNHLKNALLVFCDEGTWGGDKSTEGILKGMITEDALAVEPKGKDVFMIRSHLRMIVASNNTWVVPAGMEERRFFVTDVGDAHIQDTSYFKAIHDQMHNGGREAMLHDLLQIDISNFNLKEFPRLDSLLDQIIPSMSSVQRFWLERLRSGALLSKEDEWTCQAVTKEFHFEYLEFCKSMGDRYPVIDRQFTKAIKTMCDPVTRHKILINGRYEWVLRFPPIWDCRDQFELMIKMPVEWDEERMDGKKSPYANGFDDL